MQIFYQKIQCTRES